jgi:hypothetical protein
VLIPVGFAQVNYFHSVSTWPYIAQCTVGVKTTEFVGTTTEFAEACYDLWATNILNRMTSDVLLTKVRVKYGPNSTGPAEEFAGTATGLQSGPSTNPAECVLISKNTSLGGRQGRGRFYVPGAPAADLDASGLFDTTYVGNVQAWADAWLADMQAANIDPVLLHGVGTSDTTPEDIVSLTVQQRVATQRRRNRR